jgi:hypothetical protein
MKIEITKAVAVSASGTDAIYLYTDLPCGTWPYEGVSTATVNVAQGTAEDWLKVNLPDVPVEVITIPQMSLRYYQNKHYNRPTMCRLFFIYASHSNYRLACTGMVPVVICSGIWVYEHVWQGTCSKD